MTKRVELSRNSPGLAAVDATLADLAVDASGDSTKALYGDGTFKVPAGGGGGLTLNAPVTAHPGGGQSSAVQLATGLTPLLVPASSSDSVQLPAATAGAYCILLPEELASGASFYTSVFAKNGSSDTINGINDDFLVYHNFVVSGSGACVPGICWFYCAANGNWITNAAED
jgi:hypothetical protein